MKNATLLWVVAGGLCLPLHALEPGRPSKTSIWVAALRAIGSHDFDPAVRNPDWLAERFLGPEERKELAGEIWIQGIDMDYREAMKHPRLATVVRSMAIRTRFIDEQMKSAVSRGIRQIVILGAGFDSRAYRYRELLGGCRVIEVDYGPTQEFKRRRVQDLLGGPPANLTYAPIDFTKDKLDDVLRRAGYRKGERALFIWEGVTMYLPREAVRQTLSWFSSTAPGSSVVFDLFSQELLVAPRTKLSLDMVSQWGEPWIFGVPKGTEREFVLGTGLEPSEAADINSPETIQRFATRRDGTFIGQLPDLPPPATAYWAIHATVPTR